MEENQITGKIIEAAINVHEALGPGLMEKVYEECLCHELSRMGIRFERQKDLPVTYRGVRLDCGMRLDLVVEDQVVVEVKAVDKLTPLFDAQLLTYLKIAKIRLGLLINFNSEVLHNGIKRLAAGFAVKENPDGNALEK